MIWVFALAGGLIELVWILVLKYSRLGRYFKDIPNERSSHTKVVPRGAGFAFALALFLVSIFEDSKHLGFASMAFSLSLLGLFDDALSLSSRLRFLLQAMVVLCSLAFLLRELYTSLGPWFLVLTPFIFLYALSSINFFNFADGINGHMGIQLLVGIFSWLYLAQSSSLLPALPGNQGLWAVVGSAFVFLIANFIFRLVFMGDTGSTFVGFFLTIFPLYFLDYSTIDDGRWMLFLGALLSFTFLVWFDCFAVVLRKIMNGISFSRAHRHHFYQQLSRRDGWGHNKTTLVLGFWQAGISVSYVLMVTRSVWGVIPLAFLVLVYLVLNIRSSRIALKALKA